MPLVSLSCNIRLTLNWHLPQQSVAPVCSRTASIVLAPASIDAFIISELMLLQIHTIMVIPTHNGYVNDNNYHLNGQSFFITIGVHITISCRAPFADNKDI